MTILDFLDDLGFLGFLGHARFACLLCLLCLICLHCFACFACLFCLLALLPCHSGRPAPLTTCKIHQIRLRAVLSCWKMSSILENTETRFVKTPQNNPDAPLMPSRMRSFRQNTISLNNSGASWGIRGHHVSILRSFRGIKGAS